jgi:hypothetical protein
MNPDDKNVSSLTVSGWGFNDRSARKASTFGSVFFVAITHLQITLV